MSVGVGLVLLWVVSPLAGTVGYLQVAIPAQVFGLSTRVSRWSLRAIGLDSAALRWLATPVHRRLFGDPVTFLDRACERPDQFRVVVLGIRLTGILFVLLSVSSAALGIAVLATGT